MPAGRAPRGRPAGDVYRGIGATTPASAFRSRARARRRGSGSPRRSRATVGQNVGVTSATSAAVGSEPATPVASVTAGETAATGSPIASEAASTIEPPSSTSSTPRTMRMPGPAIARAAHEREPCEPERRERRRRDAAGHRDGAAGCPAAGTAVEHEGVPGLAPGEQRERRPPTIVARIAGSFMRSALTRRSGAWRSPRRPRAAARRPCCGTPRTRSRRRSRRRGRAPACTCATPSAMVGGADRDREVGVSPEAEVADDSPVEAALRRLEVVDDLERTRLRRA